MNKETTSIPEQNPESDQAFFLEKMQRLQETLSKHIRGAIKTQLSPGDSAPSPSDNTPGKLENIDEKNYKTVISMIKEILPTAKINYVIGIPNCCTICPEVDGTASVIFGNNLEGNLTEEEMIEILQRTLVYRKLLESAGYKYERIKEEVSYLSFSFKEACHDPKSLRKVLELIKYLLYLHVEEDTGFYPHLELAPLKAVLELLSHNPDLAYCFLDLLTWDGISIIETLTDLAKKNNSIAELNSILKSIKNNIEKIPGKSDGIKAKTLYLVVIELTKINRELAAQLFRLFGKKNSDLYNKLHDIAIENAYYHIELNQQEAAIAIIKSVGTSQ